ncbi:Alpha-galactosidase A [Tolypocladium ophioglossoides CBS 100239]|uniref:Alpha-galactosidase n=1 Tax=Tolypocladium ophioglossoides (strain CBS 100239) TaxID=1163406 RepID=A0A0L0NLJ0_TOLOC|nr:Alpha-galactosidase A [Tolypocladium ophioglossoides CBS 100239]
MISLVVLAAVARLVGTAAATQSDPLPLPPMGFNNWARFMTNINESIFVDAAEAMSKNGLLAAGYNRINLDDAWSTKERAANGEMVWDPVKFPNGLPWLTAHLKSKGFIPGIYTDAGNVSCGGYPGALHHEEIDHETFTSWSFEYLKIDGCNMPDHSEATYHEVYGRWHEILSGADHPMILSDSAPAYFSGEIAGTNNMTDWYTVMGWASAYGQLARHSADILVYPDGIYGGGSSWVSMLYNYGQEVRLARYQRPGYFNDPDFLNVDHPSYTLDEGKSHFALWCSFSAPLIISANIPALSQEEIDYLTNKDLLAVNQDRLVQQATLVSSGQTWDVLTKSLENGDRLLTILNKGSSTGDLTVSWESIGLSSKALRRANYVSAKNLWTGEQVKVSVKDGGITAKAIPSHGTAVFRIAKSISPVTPTGIIFNTNTTNCLTDNKSGHVTFAQCDGSDAQTWRVRPHGNINSLLRPDECIVDAQGAILSRHSGCRTDAWTYELSGNLINNNSKLCLTEGANGAATATSCGYELNEQVVGLPVGVTVVGITV